MANSNRNMPKPPDHQPSPVAAAAAPIPEAPIPKAPMPLVTDAPANPAEAILDPVVQFGAKDPDSTVKVETDKSGIAVTALRKGFIGNLRIAKGDRFLISNPEKWGTWMKCDDANLQAELEKKNEERIKKIRGI